MKEKQRSRSKVWKAFIYLAMAATMFILIAVVVKILFDGLPNLKPDLFSVEFSVDNQSLMPALANTVLLVFLCLLISVPIGLATSIYLVEYANSESQWVRVVRITAETLQGIPSIIYGLFGMLFFGNVLKIPYTMLSGALTMAIMCLPLIMRSSEEALMSVPNALREASFGLGARKLRTIFKIVLPSAVPGILSGIILAIGRVVGETAALMFTSGAVTQYAGIMDSGRTLALHVYYLNTESLYKNQAYGTAVVLVVLVILINAISTLLASKVSQAEPNA